MAEKIEIAWTMGVQVKGGPRIALSDAISVDAYDMIEVEIATDDVAREVQIQPASAAQVQLLMVRSDRYGEALTYKLGSAEDSPEFKLDAPHLLIGKGAVAMLGATPEALFFTNGLDETASIQILVGRKATA